MKTFVSILLICLPLLAAGQDTGLRLFSEWGRGGYVTGAEMPLGGGFYRRQYDNGHVTNGWRDRSRSRGYGRGYSDGRPAVADYEYNPDKTHHFSYDMWQ